MVVLGGGQFLMSEVPTRGAVGQLLAVGTCIGDWIHLEKARAQVIVFSSLLLSSLELSDTAIYEP